MSDEGKARQRRQVKYVITLPKGYEKAQIWSGHKGILLATAKDMPYLEIDLQQGTIKVFEPKE